MKAYAIRIITYLIILVVGIIIGTFFDRQKPEKTITEKQTAKQTEAAVKTITKDKVKVETRIVYRRDGTKLSETITHEGEQTQASIANSKHSEVASEKIIHEKPIMPTWSLGASVNPQNYQQYSGELGYRLIGNVWTYAQVNMNNTAFKNVQIGVRLEF